jgi:hypothetical protein
VKPAKLRQLVVSDLRRNFDHFMLSSIGIVIGIATFVFFIALGLGVRTVVLGKVFPIDRLEVVPRVLEVDVGPLRVGAGPDVLDDTAVAKVAEVEGVRAVFPKMRLTVPAVANGGEDLFGSEIVAEIVADGIDPTLVEADIGRGYAFGDLDDPEDPDNRGTGSPCKTDVVCPDGMHCVQRPGEDRGGCRAPVPAIVSYHLVELYNGGLRRAHGFPKVNPDAALGFGFELHLGDSMVAASRRDNISKEHVTIVGFSDKAIPIGMTIPIEYVQRFNVAYGEPEAAQRYHSAVVEVENKDQIAQVSQRIDELGFEIKNTGAQRAGLMISILMAVFGTVAVVIVVIAAVNIMHVFFMLVYQRQREIGVMRALGASRGDIGALLLAQAGVVGLIAGGLGSLLAVLASTVFDSASAAFVPDFPYKPETYFEFPPLLFLVALVFAVSFCVLGAALPARRAARTDPASVLIGR